tara:strand:+ start:649 stop:885 length:237 start_codon:yes stop_codon:yes gene_type:complete
MGYDYSKALIITDTNAHTGKFFKVHALADSSCTFVSNDMTENGSSTIAGITMNASTTIEGVVITSITLASGQVVAYTL